MPLFGSSPKEVQRQVDVSNEAAGKSLDFTRARLPAGRGQVAAMSQAGRLFGDAAKQLAGYKDPRVEKAERLEIAKQSVDALDIDINEDTLGYLGATASALMEQGLHEEAFAVVQQRDQIKAGQTAGKFAAEESLSTTELNLAKAKKALAEASSTREGIKGKSAEREAADLREVNSRADLNFARAKEKQTTKRKAPTSNDKKFAVDAVAGTKYDNLANNDDLRSMADSDMSIATSSMLDMGFTPDQVAEALRIAIDHATDVGFWNDDYSRDKFREAIQQMATSGE